MLKIDVTQSDIRRGSYQSFYACPIAYATYRATKGTALKFNAVFESGVEFEDLGTVKLPVKAQAFIAKFDAGADHPGDATVGRKAVKPFSFRLKVAIPKAGKE